MTEPTVPWRRAVAYCSVNTCIFTLKDVPIFHY